MNESSEQFEAADIGETALSMIDPESLEPPEAWTVEDFDDLWQ